MKILLCVSGSISAYKVCELASILKKNNYELKVILSSGAEKFIGKATFEGLTGEPIQNDLFESGKMMDHITLARWADLILLAPASANQVNKLSAGIADDLLSTLFLANNFLKPYWIFPAMNSQMYLHPATQSSFKKLESWGCKLYFGEEGNLACGESGPGRLMEPKLIYDLIESEFRK